MTTEHAATVPHASPATGHHAEGAHAHAVDPLWLYLAIFGALIFLTVVTVGASYVDFGQANTVIAVIIASTKAALVAVFFMHLRHDKPFHTIILVSGLFFLSFLFLFTLQDEGSRNDVDEWHGRPVEKAKVVETPAPSGAAPAPAPAHHLAARIRSRVAVLCAGVLVEVGSGGACRVRGCTSARPRSRA